MVDNFEKGKSLNTAVMQRYLDDILQSRLTKFISHCSIEDKNDMLTIHTSKLLMDILVVVLDGANIARVNTHTMVIIKEYLAGDWLDRFVFWSHVRQIEGYPVVFRESLIKVADDILKDK